VGGSDDDLALYHHAVILPSLRVVMLTPDAGFLDRRIAQEAATLARRGATVDIYPTHEPLAAPVPEVVGVRMIRPSVSEAAAIASGGLTARAKGTLTRRAPGLRRVAASVRYVTSDRAGRLIPIHAAELSRLGPHDVVFAHDLPVLPLARHVALEWDATLVCDLHEIFPETEDVLSTRTGRRYWRSIEERDLPGADGILCVNEAVEDYVRDRLAPSAPIAVVYNSVPYATTTPVRPGAIHEIYALPPAARVMVFGGSFRPDNNLVEMLDGFGQAQLDGWVLALLGSGTLEERLTARIGATGLGDRVFIGRRVRQEDLIDVLASADAGLIPYMPASKNLLIATPNKLYEYIQARLPIATSRLPMIERVISANRNGAFVDFSTPTSIARDLRRFVESDLPSITPDVLEATARAVSWEQDEERLVALVGDALARHASRTTSVRD
jgi:glycosyltransferase involved in cell wall biosynthesis